MNQESFDTPKLVELDEQHLAVIRARVALSEIPALFDRAFPEIFAAVQRAGAQIVGPPMGVTRGEPDETLDLAAAVPLAAPFVSDGEVQPETIPAGRAARMLVRGDYAQLSAAYEHLFNWVEAEDLESTGLAWEQYLTEPEPGGDPTRNETLLVVAVR